MTPIAFVGAGLVPARPNAIGSGADKPLPYSLQRMRFSVVAPPFLITVSFTSEGYCRE
jgi:hypothetical protein